MTDEIQPDKATISIDRAVKIIGEIAQLTAEYEAGFRVNSGPLNNALTALSPDEQRIAQAARQAHETVNRARRVLPLPGSVPGRVSPRKTGLLGDDVILDLPASGGQPTVRQYLEDAREGGGTGSDLMAYRHEFYDPTTPTNPIKIGNETFVGPDRGRVEHISELTPGDMATAKQPPKGDMERVLDDFYGNRPHLNDPRSQNSDTGPDADAAPTTDPATD